MKFSKEENKFRSREYRRNNPLRTGANAVVTQKKKNHPDQAAEMQKRIDDAMKAELARERGELEEMSRPEDD